MDNFYKYSTSYILFLYCEELNRKKVRVVNLKKTKIHLTDKLVSKGVRNLKECSIADLRAITRELLYKNKLKLQLKQLQCNKMLNAKNSDKKEKEEANETLNRNLESKKRELLILIS